MTPIPAVDRFPRALLFPDRTFARERERGGTKPNLETQKRLVPEGVSGSYGCAAERELPASIEAVSFPFMMNVGITLGFWGKTPPSDLVGFAQWAERVGFDSIWAGETYSSDCFTPLAWVGAHTSRIQLGTGISVMAARPPTLTAMTAMTLDHLSGGRLILGLGVSGPQVVEGWFGREFPKPIASTREYLALFRKVMRREGPVTADGEFHQLPVRGGTGLGRPLKLMTEPRRREIPIFLAAEGPRNVEFAAEQCQGWLPLWFSPYRSHIYADSLRAANRSFRIEAAVPFEITSDVGEAIGRAKAIIAFYIGGMGAPSRNFHVDHFTRMGFGETARRVQELFLSGERARAIAAVPDELADELGLFGPPVRIRERLRIWRESPVTSLILGGTDRDALERMLHLIREQE